jgi:antitoxin PrlF
MKTVVSEKGQITIPKPLRDKLGMGPGAVIVFAAAGGSLVGHKMLAQDPISRWRGRGRLPEGASVDAYLRRSRG